MESLMSGAARLLSRPSVAAAVWLVTACMASSSCRPQGIEVSPLDLPVAAPQSADPALAIVPGTGELATAWVEGDGHTWGLFFARSTDRGERWSRPILVAGGPESPGEVHPHGESSPRLVAGPRGRFALVWPNSIEVEGRKWPAAMLRFARSVDGGLSWSLPVTLNDDTAGALVSHQFHGATLVGDSALAVAWLDERNSDTPIVSGADGHSEHAAEPDAHIYFTSSLDFGRKWGPNQLGWKAACPCCRISLARGTEGQALAAWRQHFPGNVRDVVTALLSEQPAEPQRVHPDDWSYAGCPHSGPGLATSADGSAHVVWYNGKQGSAGVYYARQVQGKRTGTAAELVRQEGLGVAHPAVAALPRGGALAAYDVSPGGTRRIGLAQLLPDGRIVAQAEIEDSEGGKYPQLAVLDDSTAVVGWTAMVGEASALRLARVSLREGAGAKKLNRP